MLAIEEIHGLDTSNENLKDVLGEIMMIPKVWKWENISMALDVKSTPPLPNKYERTVTILYFSKAKCPKSTIFVRY